MNIIYNKSCETMEELADDSVNLVVTSPPYNVGKDYSGDSEDDKKEMSVYLNFLKNVFSECYRVLADGCRCVINVADTGRKPYIPLQVYITNIMEEIGFWNKGVVIWDKGPSAPKRTSWGSFGSSSNLGLRDVHEFILVFSKGHLRKDKGVSTITKDEFLKYTESIWRFNTEVRTKKEIGGHPCPFPVFLPETVIKCYSFLNDLICDPFIGSGSSAIAALKTGRRFVGYELEKRWCDVANKRIEDFMKSTNLQS